MKVPFGDLRRERSECGARVRAGIDRVLESGWFVLGKELEGFEEAFSAYLGDVHVVGVGSGTEALHLALMAAGVEPGDFVVTVPNTAVPTVSAISAAGATPLLVDVDDVGLTMDPAQLRRLLEREKPKLGRRLKAVVPVHLYGRTADMDRIVEGRRRTSTSRSSRTRPRHTARSTEEEEPAPSATLAPSASIQARTSAPTVTVALWSRAAPLTPSG